MSLKKYFSNEPIIDTNEFSQIENSENLHEEYSDNIERYIPEVDYSDPQNFVRFGLAKEYYDNSITRILDYYPYDGSTKEKLEWKNNCIDLDLYILKNLWPKSTGFGLTNAIGDGYTRANNEIGHFSYGQVPEQILFKTGPNIDNYYESSSNITRISNFFVDPYKGNTIEFWLKKDSMVSVPTGTYVQECVIDLYPIYANTIDNRVRLSLFTGTLDNFGAASCNHENIPSSNPNAGYAGLSFTYGKEISGGSDSNYNNYFVENYLDYFVLDNEWHHYAVSFKNEAGTFITIKLYRDGVLKHTDNSLIPSNRAEIHTGSYIGSIGSLYAGIEDNTARYFGKLSASLDEIRIWNSARTSEDIYKYYNFNVGGGSNSDDVITDLGIYFKFNEGITGDSDTDSVVLDYAGRNSNGLWIGYSSHSRQTGSAIIDSGASTAEISDPIIRSNHPSIIELEANLEASGSLYDDQNPNNIYNFVPTWIAAASDDLENNTIKNILQTVATVLDEMHLKSEKVKELKRINYFDNTKYKNNPYLSKTLLSKDFEISNLFLQPSLFEQLNSKDEEISFGEDIQNIKNFIYQNLYNNLTHLYKSKGTKQAIDKILNIIGINSENCKLNLYGDNITYDFKTNNYEEKVTKKKYIKFSTNNEAFIKSNSGTDGIYNFYNGIIQMEVDLFFPKLNDLNSSFFTPNNVLTSSIATLSKTGAGDALELRFVKENYNSKHGKFQLYSAIANDYIETNTLYNVYDNKRFFVSFGIKTDFYFSFYNISQTNYKWYIQAIADGTEEYTESLKSSVFSGENEFSIGYNTYYCDIDIAAARVYIKNHDRNEGITKSKDVNNYGNYFPNENSDFYGINHFPNDKSLLLNWEFDCITGSDASGEFTVYDFSSGSDTPYSENQFGGSLYYNKNIHGYGENFEESSISIVETKYILNLQQKLPENLCDSYLIDITDGDEYSNFKRDLRPISYIYSLERSYFQNISQEMLNIFAGINSFNNIIGEPVQKFRREYKSLNKLRNAFYEKVENIPDIEKYVSLYKWIDSSIEQIIKNFIPLSTNIIEDNGIVVESHVLERNKYQHKFMNYRDKEPKILQNITGIGEMQQKWDGLGIWWESNKREKQNSNQISVQTASSYYNSKNDIYRLNTFINYGNKNHVIIPSNNFITCSAIEFDAHGLDPIPPPAAPDVWSPLSTFDYWDIYTLDLPTDQDIAMEKLYGELNNSILTGSRAGYSGSFYGENYSEASQYPRSSWFSGKRWISRHKSASSSKDICYRFDGINPLSGSNEWTLYTTLVRPASVYHACYYFASKYHHSDGYAYGYSQMAAPLGSGQTFIISYSNYDGSFENLSPPAGSNDLGVAQGTTNLIIFIKTSTNYACYAVRESGYSFCTSLNFILDSWPTSDNLNFLSDGTYDSLNSINTCFSWVSLHSASHSVSQINEVISEINSKQGFSFVPIT